MGAEITNNEVVLTRGDTLRCKVDIYYDSAKTEPYTPVEGDGIRFALKRKKMVRDNDGYQEYEDGEPLILKEIPIDTMELLIEPEDTKELGFGSYEYDVEITHADGTVDTFIRAAPFKLTKEVH